MEGKILAQGKGWTISQDDKGNLISSTPFGFEKQNPVEASVFAQSFKEIAGQRLEDQKTLQDFLPFPRFLAGLLFSLSSEEAQGKLAFAICDFFFNDKTGRTFLDNGKPASLDWDAKLLFETIKPFLKKARERVKPIEPRKRSSKYVSGQDPRANVFNGLTAKLFQTLPSLESKGRFVQALFDYSFAGTLPKDLQGQELAFFDLSKPQLDLNRERFSEMEEAKERLSQPEKETFQNEN